jgi:glycogen debranching enzyme
MKIAVASTTRAWFGQMYDSAVRTLDRNIVHDERGAYIRAGDGYTDPWTRDAALNTWGAASLLRPDIARATLLRVCDDLDDGSRLIAQDNQWWDQIVWVIAARDLALTTGDRGLLRTVLEVGGASLEVLHRDRFRPPWGLYAGPALMQDGISGLPTPPATSGEPSSFVLDYPDAHEVMSLSTNVLYVAAYRALDATARDLGDDPGEWAATADRLTSAIREHLTDGTSFGYFRHGAGALVGTLDRHREAAGLALAVLFDVAPAGSAAATLESVGRGPAGAVNVAPHFADRYSDDHPGRHNAICWPMVMGLVGLASASVRDVAGVDRTLEDLQALVEASDGRFDEVYDAVTGAPSGGWQCGFLWDSEPNQTWSATSFLRLVHLGGLGLRVGIDGVRLEPIRPAAGDVVTARGITVGTAVLDITVEPGGESSVRVDGVDVTHAEVHVPGDAVGHRRVHVVVGR